MEFYKVLFVDDESWAIDDILLSVPWEKLGFEVIGRCEKAREAVAVVREKKPQLVFVDINMPEMNGFEFIRRCKKEGAASDFIILSAYSDFEFAREAIKESVLDYCLKPVNPAALIKTLGEIKNTLGEKEAARLAEEEGGGALLRLPQNEERFRRILEYLEANFTKKLFLQDVADRFFINKNYLCFLFKKFTGSTFSAYVARLRVREAKRLLEATDLPLRVVASEAGFNDDFYFSKVFKMVCGITPHKYRLETAGRQAVRAAQPAAGGGP